MSEGPKANYYEVLEINENTNPDEIRKAYRKLALKWHPDKNENKKEAEEKFKLINEAYAVLSDKAKKKEYDDFRKYGAAGRGFEFSHFGRNFDPFEAFRTFFQDEGFGFEDEDDIFSQNNIFRRFGGFGSGFDRGFSKHFDRDFDRDFGKDFGGFGGNSNFKFSSSSSSSTGGIGAATTKSVKKTTQIINGQRVTKTETTLIDKNGNKKVEITEEIDDGRGNKSTNKKQLYGESNGINNKKQIR